jgi:hypothetical protein
MGKEGIEKIKGFLKGSGIENEEQFIETISNKPEVVPLVFRAGIAIGASLLYERFKEEDNLKKADQYLALSRVLTQSLYNAIVPGKKVVFPQYPYFSSETTEEGAIGLIIDPDEDYSNIKQAFLLLKKVDRLRAKQAFKDSVYFRNDPHFKMEYILARIPCDEGEERGGAYLWKEFIIGPDLSYVFRILDRKIEGSDMETSRLCKNLEKVLSDIVTKRLLYWQQNAPELMGLEKNSEEVIQYYLRKFPTILDDFAQYTDLSYSSNELNDFRAALQNLDWSFINLDTIVRNLGATFKNIVISTGQLNISPEKFLELFTENGKKRRINTSKLEKMLFSVDTPNKYTHVLEDPWDMDLSLEGKAKKSAVNMVARYYARKGIDLKHGKYLIGAYRAYRKAALILSKFVPKNVKNFKAGLISKEEFEQKEALYRDGIRHLLKDGEELLEQAKKDAHKRAKDFDLFVTLLRKLSTYEQIRY